MALCLFLLVFRSSCVRKSKQLMILITMKGKPFYASVIDFGECAIAFFFFF